MSARDRTAGAPATAATPGPAAGGARPWLGPFAAAGDDLRIGGVSCSQLAERFGTPLYAYDLGLVEERYAALREALPKRCDVYYALKANPNLAVASLLAQLGAGAEAASRGELLLAARAGFALERTMMAGPAKTAEDHREAVTLGIRAVNVESAEEAHRLDAIARAHGCGRARPRFPIGLRVNTRAAIEEERSIIGGAGPRKFGFDEEQVPEVLDAVRRCVGLRVAGVHVFNASNVRDAAALAGNAARILGLAEVIASSLTGDRLEYVDVGGGLGIPYGPADPTLDVAALGRGLEAALEVHAPGPLRHVRLALEPGRYLVGEAGVYLTRVIEMKRSRGRRIALVDGGIHHMVRPALVGAPHPVVAATRASRPAAEPCDVGGTLCTGLDFLAREAPLPELAPGDLLAVLCAGAYGFTESMPLFLSHPVPPEIVVRGGDAAIARPRRLPEEELARQLVPRLGR